MRKTTITPRKMKPGIYYLPSDTKAQKIGKRYYVTKKKATKRKRR